MLRSVRKVSRCHVKIREGSVYSTACKVEYFRDNQANNKICAEQNVEDLPTLSFYMEQSATTGDGDSLNCVQLPVNYSNRKDVCLYKNLIYPDSLKTRWNALNVSL